MTTSNETFAPTSRKNVPEKGILMPNWSITCQSFRSHASILALEKQPKKLNFQSFFLPLRDPFVATFNETRAPTSRIYVTGQGMVMSNW